MLFVAPFLSCDHTKEREPNGVTTSATRCPLFFLAHVLIENLAHEC